MTKNEEFSDTRIFRAAGLVMRDAFPKVKNMEIDIKKTCGHKFLNHVSSCAEFMKLSYEADKNDKETKLIYGYAARDCAGMAEVDLQLIVYAELFPGKAKTSKNGTKTVEKSEYKQFKLGTPEIYKNMGDLITQIKGWNASLEEQFDEEKLKDIKKRAQNIIVNRHLN